MDKENHCFVKTQFVEQCIVDFISLVALHLTPVTWKVSWSFQQEHSFKLWLCIDLHDVERDNELQKAGTQLTVGAIEAAGQPAYDGSRRPIKMRHFTPKKMFWCFVSSLFLNLTKNWMSIFLLKEYCFTCVYLGNFWTLSKQNKLLFNMRRLDFGVRKMPTYKRKTIEILKAAFIHFMTGWEGGETPL